MTATDLIEHRTIGILGCGNIFERYISGLQRFPGVRVVRAADVDDDRAKAAATPHGIAWGSPDDLFADDSVDIVVNLTPPVFHAETTAKALLSGKHVYVEKPVTSAMAELGPVRAAVLESGKVAASAPDTFLGSANQTARYAIDEGLIGRPFGASAFIRHSQVEKWHPNPAFLFAPGGGPVMDMGPYYAAALVNLLGPVASVTATTQRVLDRRDISSPNRAVDFVDVTVDTHASGYLTFASGAVATVQMSFDVWHTELPYLEIYGTKGTLALPNPNHFDGNVRIRTRDDDDWRILAPVVPLFGAIGSSQQFERGLGVSDLAQSLNGAPLRVGLDFAEHVLETLEAFSASNDASATYPLTTRCERPQIRTRNYQERP